MSTGDIGPTTSVQQSSANAASVPKRSNNEGYTATVAPLGCPPAFETNQQLPPGYGPPQNGPYPPQGYAYNAHG